MSCGAWIDPNWSSVRLICAMKASISPGENQGLSATDREHPVLTVRSVRRGDRSCNAPIAPFHPWERAFHSGGMRLFRARRSDWGDASIPQADLRIADAEQGGVAGYADREPDGLPHGWRQAAAVCCRAGPGATGDGWLPRSACHCAGSVAGSGLTEHRQPVSASPARALPWSHHASSCS